MKPSHLQTWQGCNVTLLPLHRLFPLICLPFSSFLFYHHLCVSLYDTTDWQTLRPYVEGHSQASPVFNSDHLCYQALGLIFCTNIKLLHLKPLTTDPLSLWIPRSSGQLPDFPWTSKPCPTPRFCPRVAWQEGWPLRVFILPESSTDRDLTTTTPSAWAQHTACEFPHCWCYTFSGTMSFKSSRPPHSQPQSSSPSKRQSPRWPHSRPQSSPSKRPPAPSSHNSAPGHNLVLPSQISKKQCSYGTKGQVQYCDNEVLAEPLRYVLIQQQPSPQISTSAAIPLSENFLDEPFMDTADRDPPLPVYVLIEGGDPELWQQHQQQKREQQWAKWTNEIIPSLIQPYLWILHESNNLSHLNHHLNTTLSACSCQRQASVNVTGVFFECKSL